MTRLTTEAANPASANIDTLAPLEIVRLMNAEDAKVAEAVGREAENIARAIEWIAERLKSGWAAGVYRRGDQRPAGCARCLGMPSHLQLAPEMVVGLIAGGYGALTRAVEGAEDHPELAVKDLQAIQFNSGDVLVGIATSGRTPYVIGGLRYARQVGARAIGLACNDRSALADVAELMITPVVGPEVISGSTRLKAGTATKMVLNMLTTGAMVLLGKTYGNLMVDLKATNTKLSDRTRRIVAQLTGLTEAQAQEVLSRCDGELKTSVVAQRHGVPAEVARQMLAAAGGQLRTALQAQPAEPTGRA
jgi:N-acetylmuramic acid 6-phosphate etherase